MPSDEQQVVATRYAATRDPRDAERLVVGNLRLVVKIATEMGGHRRSDFMDLVQEGNAGLLYALKKFDPTRGIQAGVVRRVVDPRFHHALPDGYEPHRAFQLDPRGAQTVLRSNVASNDVSLDAPVGRADAGGWVPRGRTMLETFSDDDDVLPDARLEARELHTRFHEALGDLRPELDDRERAILDKRLLSESPTPLREIARRFDITGERTRQIEQRLVARLRKRVADPGERLWRHDGKRRTDNETRILVGGIPGGSGDGRRRLGGGADRRPFSQHRKHRHHGRRRDGGRARGWAWAWAAGWGWGMGMMGGGMGMGMMGGCVRWGSAAPTPRSRSRTSIRA